MMDKLNLWSDDPEEILLDLGFGYDEPDLSGRIPARFLHYQSKARGITIQVFLEAQKNRLDLENPDVGNRFRQLQVLQEVTTTFSGLIGHSLQTPLDKQLPPDVQERKRKMAVLFRRASKKSLGNAQSHKHHTSSGLAENSQACSVPESLQDSGISRQTKVPLMRVKPVCLEAGYLGSVATNQEADSDLDALEEGFPETGNKAFWSKSGPGNIRTPKGMTETLSGSTGWDVTTERDVKPGSSTSTLHSLATNTPDVGQYIPFSARPPIAVDPSPSPPLKTHPEAASKDLNNKTQPTQKPPPLSLPSVLMSKDLSSFSPKLLKTTHSKILPDVEFASLNPFSISKQITSLSTEESEAPDLPSESFCKERLSLFGPSVSEPLPPQPSAELSPPFSSDTVTLRQSHFLVGDEKTAHKNTNPGFILYPASSSASLGSRSPSSAATDSSETNGEDASFLGSEKSPVTDADHEPTLSEPSENEERLPAILRPLKVPHQPALSCNSHHQQDTVNGVSENGEPSQQQETKLPQNDIKSSAPAVDNIPRWNMNQVTVNGGSVFMSDRDSCRHESKETFIQTETDQKSTVHTVSDVHSSKTRPENLQELRRSGAKSRQNESYIRHSDACEQQVCHKTEVQPHRPTTESLGVVQETSVDDGEDEDADFFQQLHAESKVYWAEPALITILAEEINTFQDSDAIILSEDTVSLSTLSSSTISGPDQISGKAGMHSDPCLSMPNSCSSLCASAEKSSNPSVCGQTPPSLSSHIIHRKDVPLQTESKHTLFPSTLTLDTSSPLRALQSWKNLQSQRNALTHKLSQTYLCTQSGGDSQTPTRRSHRPSQGLSSTTSFPLLSTDLALHSSTPVILRNDGATEDQISKMVDWINTPGPGSEDEEHQDVDWNEANSQQTLNKKCCCSCHRPQNCCSRRYPHPQHISCSIEEWETMMEGLQQFHSVFNNMVKRFSEEQAAAYSMLSDTERENIQDIEELRCSIKLEAAELERQLKELSHDYSDSLKREMDSLRYEQSQLCSQVALSGTVLTLSPASHRAAAIQCSLLPWNPPADAQTSSVSSSTGKPPFGSVSITDSQATTSEKLDILGLLHRVGKSCIQ